MELPAPLKAAVEQMLAHEPIERLARASEKLSDRYRREVRDGKFHLDGELAAKAYLATRLPATYAAVRAALSMVEEASPEFHPTSLLDFGAGPGTVFWATTDAWPDLGRATLVEASPAIRSVGEALAKASNVATGWLAGDITGTIPPLEPADLVTLAYVLDEIAGTAIPNVVRRLWDLTAHTIVIVEPGTPAGWRRIIAARQTLIEAGAQLVAPCAHAKNCPIVEPDWCHFSRRVARSRLHRLSKGAEVPWEDEKYIFIAASRFAASPPAARVLAPPRSSSGLARLKLCLSDGRAEELTISRRDGAVFKAARRADWGDAFEPEVRDGGDDD
ncbi:MULTISPECIES: small ribosomal subunit Rsm22 family protein [Alphaproteobacteria]|uniref:Methyltransferase type 11 n=2 Tax=Alphaproteobacteria TaxID=28211 RepID=A0A512HGS6_9HYPH|nr:MULTISPECIES: small ribosomal subunit Rsm22 family protein [Alphaproteobacteria]GEO84590.1 methyltransferase type 11 [Ciceribacter naphthalenivorans]GLR22553.1 methyltransferase type 11 [Ciceribacter naphthalenivorans]GLT05409.1 methyltransferase type 11 [Sphingomonas psychrolutea]